MTEILAGEFSRMGHKVTVITRTLAAPESTENSLFTVIRAPSWRQLIRLVANCDVFLHNHLSLKVAYPLIWFRRPWIIIYQTWYPTSGLRGFLQPILSRFALNVAISRAVAEYIRPQCLIIPNAYNSVTFRKLPGLARDQDLIFVGRLVEDKGLQILLDSLAILKRDAKRPRLTVVGDGPYAATLIQKANDLDLMNQVEFVGERAGSRLADLLNRHKILVVPSLWHEPFGIVALEGIACGCVVIGSSGGGLKDAIGPCGVTVPNGDAPALASSIASVLSAPESWNKWLDAGEEHLRRHSQTEIVKSYMNAITGLVGRELTNRPSASEAKW